MSKTFYVSIHNVKRFIEEVDPIAIFYSYYENEIINFEFSEDEDTEAAQRWIYANENQMVFYKNKYIGDIYYHNKEYGYCFVCDKDDKDYYYFDTPEDAESALIEYWESRYN